VNNLDNYRFNVSYQLIQSLNHDKKSKTLDKIHFFILICLYMLSMIQSPNLSIPSDFVMILAVAVLLQFSRTFALTLASTALLYVQISVRV
jgi:hypothetical protein